MAEIRGYVKNAGGSALAAVRVRFTLLSSTVSGNVLIFPTFTDVISSADGSYSVNLDVGVYQVALNGTNTVQLSVPATSETYTATEVFSSDFTFDSSDIATLTYIAAHYSPIGHTHAAADVVSGTFDVARLGSGTANSSKYLRGDSSWQTLDKTAVGLSNVENTALSTWAGSTSITTLGTISTGVWQGTAINASYLGAHSHAASDVTSGTFSTARLGSGTANSGAYLRGDSSWQTLDKAAVGLSNVENTALSTWAGTSNITTVGTIGTGTWQGTAIAATYIGTHSHAAADVTSGTFATARLGSGTANSAKYLAGDSSWQTLDKTAVGLGNVENTALSTWAGTTNITTLGTIATGVWNGTAITATYIGAHAHAGADITSGTVDPARLGSGSSITTKYLRGDSSWQTLTSSTVGLSNVENTALSTWAGTTNITTLGTIGTGTWQGGVIAPAYLGTGTPTGAKYLAGDGVWTTFPSVGSGTVTSVALTAPAFISVSGSPVTSSGTLALSLANQSANTVFSGPTSGGAAAPTFRALVAGDIPSLDAAKITSGTMATARLGSGTANSSTFLRGDSTWAALGRGKSRVSIHANYTTLGSEDIVEIDGDALAGDITLNVSATAEDGQILIVRVIGTPGHSITLAGSGGATLEAPPFTWGAGSVATWYFNDDLATWYRVAWLSS